jgi:hypothetical protein
MQGDGDKDSNQCSTLSFFSATSQDADAIAAEIIKTLPKRSQGE